MSFVSDSITNPQAPPASRWHTSVGTTPYKTGLCSMELAGSRVLSNYLVIFHHKLYVSCKQIGSSYTWKI